MQNTSNKFAKTTVWIILILLTLALVLPSMIPLFERNATTSITPEQLQEIQRQLNAEVTKVETVPASSEAERKEAEDTIAAIQKEAEDKLKKSSEEAAR